MKMAGETSLRICETCPWLRKNHGRPHQDGWYTRTNLRRLWRGIRTGAAPGMVCHSTDPHNPQYGGAGRVIPGHEAECGGAVLLVAMNVQAFQEQRPQPFQPPLTKHAIAKWAWKILVRGGTVSVDDRTADVGLPWQEASDHLEAR